MTIRCEFLHPALAPAAALNLRQSRRRMNPSHGYLMLYVMEGLAGLMSIRLSGARTSNHSLVQSLDPAASAIISALDSRF